MRSLFLKIIMVIFVLVLISILVGVEADFSIDVQVLKEIRQENECK